MIPGLLKGWFVKESLREPLWLKNKASPVTSDCSLSQLLSVISLESLFDAGFPPRKGDS